MAAPPTEAPPRLITPETPRTPYRRRHGEKKTTLHWGQRKLLISEIEFLARYGACDGPCTVVYAGAAPGTHILHLHELFEDADFVLVDPNKFQIIERPRLRIVHDYFCTALAKKLRAEAGADRTVLFLSDIRTADYSHQDRAEADKFLVADNEAQAEWALALRADHAMLKFNLPYGEGATAYLDGEVWFPVWARQTTTECRLVCDASGKRREYNHRDYEDVMFHFNTYTRDTVYPTYKKYAGVGYDYRFDCAREIDILADYVTRMGLGDPVDLVPEMSDAISKFLGGGFTLATKPLTVHHLPRGGDNADGQRAKKVRKIGQRSVAHPLSDALTEAKGGGVPTDRHAVMPGVEWSHVDTTDAAAVATKDA